MYTYRQTHTYSISKGKLFCTHAWSDVIKRQWFRYFHIHHVIHFLADRKPELNVVGWKTAQWKVSMSEWMWDTHTDHQWRRNHISHVYRLKDELQKTNTSTTRNIHCITNTPQTPTGAISVKHMHTGMCTHTHTAKHISWLSKNHHCHC